MCVWLYVVLYYCFVPGGARVWMRGRVCVEERACVCGRERGCVWLHSVLGVSVVLRGSCSGGGGRVGVGERECVCAGGGSECVVVCVCRCLLLLRMGGTYSGGGKRVGGRW